MSANDTQIATTAKSEIDWVRHHLIVIGVAALFSIGAIFAIETLLANRAHDQWQQALGLLNQMQKQNDQVQATTKAQIDALTQQNVVLEQQYSAAMQAIASRDAQLLRDRGEIKSLPPTTLATKWGASANEPAPVILANGDFDVPLPLGQKSYDALLQVPVLTKDNTDLKAAVVTKTQEAANNQQKVEDEQKAHKSDNETCKQTIATKDAEIKSVKADARKRNIIVSVLSLAIGLLLHH